MIQEKNYEEQQQKISTNLSAISEWEQFSI